MLRNPQILTGEGFALRLAAYYAALCAAIGVQLPFLPVWLAAKGLDAQAIGIVLAVPMVVRVFAIPMAARMADRYDALRAGIVIAAIASVAGFAVLGLAQGLAGILLIFAVASVAYAPLMPLAEAYALRGLAERGGHYGPVRLWGSVAFIVGSFGAGLLFDWIDPLNLIWLIAASMAPTVIAAWTLVPLSSGGAGRPAMDARARAVFRDPAFIAVIAAASLLQASHAVYYGFCTLDWRAHGIDGTTIGALWALGVLAEIVLFALSGRLPPFVSPVVLLIVGGVGGVIRWTAMAFDPPAAALPLLQILHALTFGATHLGTMGFVARAAPPGLAASAQSYLWVSLGLVMAASMTLSGELYGRYGGRAYTAMALASFVGALCALVAQRLKRRAWER